MQEYKEDAMSAKPMDMESYRRHARERIALENEDVASIARLDAEWLSEQLREMVEEMVGKEGVESDVNAAATPENP